MSDTVEELPGSEPPSAGRHFAGRAERIAAHTGAGLAASVPGHREGIGAIDEDAQPADLGLGSLAAVDPRSRVEGSASPVDVSSRTGYSLLYPVLGCARQ
ncbi:hypothetical protein ACFY93_13245 [Streptomyces sp. NPDC008313]|uniref:hypothetical protein n=1 Tax=Streptomyces sp. NPDC008313 TaxID=3364826 RepID=UPI0036EB8052